MLERVVRRHFVLLAAFFVQPHPPAFALRIIVFDVHVQRRRDAREAVDEQRDQRAVAQPDDRRDVDAVDELFRLVAVEHRGLAFLDDMLRPAHGGGRIAGAPRGGDEHVTGGHRFVSVPTANGATAHVPPERDNARAIELVADAVLSVCGVWIAHFLAGPRGTGKRRRWRRSGATT